MRILIAAVVLALSGCGGGGSSDSGDNTPPPSADEKPGGFFTGSFVSDGSGQALAVSGVVLETGEAIFLSQYGIYSTHFDPDGSQVDAEFEAFALWGTTWDGLNTYLHGNIEATVSERAGINGEYTLGGDSGTFSLAYDDEYEESSSLAKTAGTWGYTIPAYSYAISVAVDGSGNVYGQANDGCVYQGDIATVDTSYNAYRVTGFRVDCPSGSLTGGVGIAYVTDDGAGNQVLAYGVQFAQDIALIDFLYKQ